MTPHGLASISQIDRVRVRTLDASIAICTFNRSASLERTLTSLARLDVPMGTRWEIIVVNNNCSDATDQVIAKFASTLPIRREFEPHAGLSLARNRAIEASRGAYILWTDDDVVVRRDWLKAYLAAFGRWPNAAIFGGKIVPHFDTPSPGWLADALPHVSALFGLLDMGDTPFQLDPELAQIPFGSNFVVRADAQRAHRYDPTLGLMPGRQRTDEETSVLDCIMRSGLPGYWVPEAYVEHCISTERQTLAFLGKRLMAHGETLQFRLERSRPYRGPKIMGMPRWVVRQMISRTALYSLARLTANPRLWIKPFIAYNVHRGVYEYWRSQLSGAGD